MKRSESNTKSTYVASWTARRASAVKPTRDTDRHATRSSEYLKYIIESKYEGDIKINSIISLNLNLWNISKIKSLEIHTKVILQ